MFQRQLSCVVVTNVGCSCHVLCCSFNAIFSHSEFNRLLTSTLQLSMLPQAHTDNHTHAPTHTKKPIIMNERIQKKKAHIPPDTGTHTTRHRHTYHQTQTHIPPDTGTHTTRHRHTYHQTRIQTHTYTHTDT